MASVKIVFRKDRVNKKNGLAPINLFIIKDRKITKVATGIKVTEKDWDEKNKKIRSSNRDSKELNYKLTDLYAKLNNKVIKNEFMDSGLSGQELKEDHTGKKPLPFFPFAQEVIDKYKRQGQIATHARSQGIIEKLKAWDDLPASLTFQRFTPDLLAKYEKYLREKLSNRGNTIHSNLKFFRFLFNTAINSDKLDYKYYPFNKYKIKAEKTQRQYLTEDELTTIINIDCSSGLKLDLHRDMFVFSAYTGGLRVSDVLKLKWKNLDKTHIHLTIKKTGGQLSIKVPAKAFEIIEKYKPTKPDKCHYIFPVLPNGLDENNLVALDNEISKATAYINKNLKTIAKLAEVNKTLSFHISRHTWATRALRKGISIDKVSKLMGHAQIKETQVYAKIVNEELDKAMDVFND